MPVRTTASPAHARFPEREFYLREFRGRTLAIVCPVAALRSRRLRNVVDALDRNGTRVLLFSNDNASLARVTGPPLVFAQGADDERTQAARIWRRVRRQGRLGVVLGLDRDFADVCCRLAAALRVFKVVWIDSGGGLRRGRKRLSFVHRDELHELRTQRARAPLLLGIDAMLEGGVESVNLCTVEGLREELFTYEGSGTLFTRERYVEVRPLAIDEFDAASALIARGVREGALAARTRRELDRVLAAGYGAFIEGRDLAGVASLLPYAEEDGAGASGEIACLYTLTRFLGEGVGVELVERVLREAHGTGLDFVFACTAGDAAARFFRRRGFRSVSRGRVPAKKWEGYDRSRLARVRVYRRSV